MNLIEPVSKHFRINEYQTKALKKLGVVSLHNLLYHFPARYISSANEGVIQTTTSDGVVSLIGTISKTKARKAWKSKIPMTEATLKDESGSLHLLWLHQPYISKMFPEGSLVVVAGKIKEKDGKRSMINPEITHAKPFGSLASNALEARLPNANNVLFGTSTEHNADMPLIPVYPESRGVTSRWFLYTIQKILTQDVLDALHDPIPKDILKKYNLPALATALVWMHTPKTETDAIAARKRFAFEEVFFIQLQKQQERSRADALPTWDISVSKKELTTFIKRFPFTPTNAQTRAIESILENFDSPHAMSRLLEGDVGSGKTFVAAATAYCVVTSRPKSAEGKDQDFGNLQTAYMAPTEILAQQHFESFIEFFKDLPIQIGLITSSGCKKFPSKVNPNGWTDISRPQLLKWVASGEIPILIGTHALIQKSVKFKHLAYVIIDEQHRFGTNQRALLARKTDAPDRDAWRMPHLLSMTATPIPRTLALTVYGDLDLTLLDEQPKGRKEIKTEIVTPAKRAQTYAHIQTLIDEGRQVFVVCPRIDEPDPAKETALRAKSVVEEAKRLKHDVFPKSRIGIVHGKMKPQEKEGVMKEFSEGAIDILVATSVIEVGVNVPNATAIIIEGADRFGLAQLHQLRGRVLRSSYQAYCYLFTDSKSASTSDRLKALASSANGFELAERDLELRGSGELYGGRQWGITDVGMEALRNLKMVEAARNEARQLIETDSELRNTPLLKDAVRERESVHFE
ncbi:MAG: ATP-dependent DNA helicase RecG [Candidatus Campbellbacteria bacterium]|nr:ATP-dependent DNA helicase RecG [Candidatus Campbellbacteria bacterium]